MKHIIANPRHKINDLFQLTTHTTTKTFNACKVQEGGHQLRIYMKNRQECFIHPSALLRGADQLPWLVTQFLLYRPFLFVQTRVSAKRHPTQSYTSCAPLKLPYRSSKGFPTKGSEPANVNISTLSKCSASSQDLFHSYREGSNSTEIIKPPVQHHIAPVSEVGRQPRSQV